MITNSDSYSRLPIDLLVEGVPLVQDMYDDDQQFSYHTNVLSSPQWDPQFNQLYVDTEDERGWADTRMEVEITLPKSINPATPVSKGGAHPAVRLDSVPFSSYISTDVLWPASTVSGSDPFVGEKKYEWTPVPLDRVITGAYNKFVAYYIYRDDSRLRQTRMLNNVYLQGDSAEVQYQYKTITLSKRLTASLSHAQMSTSLYGTAHYFHTEMRDTTTVCR